MIRDRLGERSHLHLLWHYRGSQPLFLESAVCDFSNGSNDDVVFECRGKCRGMPKLLRKVK